MPKTRECRCCRTNLTRKKKKVRPMYVENTQFGYAMEMSSNLLHGDSSSVREHGGNSGKTLSKSSASSLDQRQTSPQKQSYGLPKMLIKKSTNQKLSNGYGYYSSVLIPRTDEAVSNSNAPSNLSDEYNDVSKNCSNDGENTFDPLKNGVNKNLEVTDSSSQNITHLEDSVLTAQPDLFLKYLKKGSKHTASTVQNSCATDAELVMKCKENHSVQCGDLVVHSVPTSLSSPVSHAHDDRNDKELLPSTSHNGTLMNSKSEPPEKYETIFKPKLNFASKDSESLISKHVEKYVKRSNQTSNAKHKNNRKRRCDGEEKQHEQNETNDSNSMELSPSKKSQNTTDNLDNFGNIFTNLERFASISMGKSISETGTIEDVPKTTAPVTKTNDAVVVSRAPFRMSTLKVTNSEPLLPDIFDLPDFKSAVSDVMNRNVTNSRISTTKIIPLTVEQNRKVDGAFNLRANHFILNRDFDLLLSVNDIQTLCYPNLINDIVVNLYFRLIADRSKKNPEYPSVYAYSTYYFPKMMRAFSDPSVVLPTHEGVFDHEIVLFPVYMNSHWSLAVAMVKEREIKYYNSLGTCDDVIAAVLVTFVYTQDVPTNSHKQWKFVHVRDIPRQLNRFDCGVFVCQYAEYISRYAPLAFNQSYMAYFRRKMACELLHGRLL